MTLAAAGSALSEVVWVTARHAHSCDECTAEIHAGESMAIYNDVFVIRNGINGSDHLSITRHYCLQCGYLLEDSLTTTEALND